MKVGERAMKDHEEAPLIGTLRFVFVLGVVFAISWFGMYALMRGRW